MTRPKSYNPPPAPERRPMTLGLKGCSRCKGDVFPERDQFGEYLHCLQCGYQVDALAPAAVA